MDIDSDIHPLPDHPQPETPPQSPVPEVRKAKAFIPSSCKLVETQDYLTRVALVVAYGRAIKPDDVSQTLAEVSGITGSWTTRRLRSSSNFFMACPSFQSVHDLVAHGQIHGEGFSLAVDHWDQINRGTPHGLRFKVAASLIDLPLVCWNTETVGIILSSFGSPLRASKASSSWKDLTSFDVSFLCEDIESLPQIISVTVDHFTFEVKLQINYVSPYISFTDQSTPLASDHGILEEEDEEFWFGSVPQWNTNSTAGGGHTSTPTNTSPEREVPRSVASSCQLSLTSIERLVNLFSVLAVEAQQPGPPSASAFQKFFFSFCQVLLTSNINGFFPGFKICSVAGFERVSNRGSSFKSLLPRTPDLSPQYPSLIAEQPKLLLLSATATFHLEPIPIKKIFSSILNALSQTDSSSSSNIGTSETFTTPPNMKRSARLRSKKARAMGVDIASLSEHDVLFINSLTAGDIAKFGFKCGVDILAQQAKSVASRLKLMERKRCKMGPTAAQQTV